MISRNIFLIVVLIGAQISFINQVKAQKEKYDLKRYLFIGKYDTLYLSLIRSTNGDTNIFHKFVFHKEDDRELEKGEFIGKEYVIKTNNGYLVNNIFLDTSKLVHSSYSMPFNDDGCDSILVSILRKDFDTTINSVKVTNCISYKLSFFECSNYNYPKYIISYFDLNKKLEVLRFYHVFRNPIIRINPDGEEIIEPYDTVYFNMKDTVIMNIPDLVIERIIWNNTIIEN